LTNTELKWGWKKIVQANGPQKQAVVAIFISDKADFKPKLTKETLYW
jgi:hypothetical protein